MGMTRKEAIKIFKNMLDAWDNYYTIAQSDKKREAVWLAISSLETDEAYQLEYERTTKNDLGVDYISRADVKAKKIYSHERHEYVVPVAEIDWLPSVTPQEPMVIPIAEVKFDEDKLKELVNKAVLTVAPQEPCDICEVGNPCLYCKHEFEPQESEDKE